MYFATEISIITKVVSCTMRICKALQSILFFSSIHCIVNKELQILPEHESCLSEECMTLSQLASNSSEFLADEFEIVLISLLWAITNLVRFYVFTM